MHLALYGDGGFYSGSGRAGRRGDFLTSPEVGPLFGNVVANAIDAAWTKLGSPDGFQIVEVRLRSFAPINWQSYISLTLAFDISKNV